MNKGPVIGIGLAALVVLGLGYMILSSSDADVKNRLLDKSPMGIEALTRWLPDQGIKVVRSNPRLTPSAANLSLAVVPLYDIDLFANAEPPETPAAEMLQATQRDIDWWVVTEKTRSLPTLIVLPKWRTGFAKSLVAHDTTLIPLPGMGQIFSNLYLPQNLLLRTGPQMLTAQVTMAPAPPRRIAVFQAQLFNRDRLPLRCAELLGVTAGALLIECVADQEFDTAFYLSDPDLFNNHGLSLAENASFAADMIANLRARDATAGQKPIYLDTSDYLSVVTAEVVDGAQYYDRGATEYARFFDYPLSVLWAIAGVILGLAGWRGALRFGPAQRPVADMFEHSKTVGIDAKARLLRVSGNDGRMVGEFVRARLDSLADAAFGGGTAPQIAHGPTHERLFKLLARRDATLAAHFRAVSNDLMTRGATMPQTELYHWLETFRDLLERLTHGPDQISKPD